MPSENIDAFDLPHTSRRTLSLGKRWIDVNFLILGIWPLILLVIKSGWGFTPLGTIDPWVYLGYLLDLPTHERVFPGTYYGTRLSFLLPGYALYQLFPPLIANYVLHLGIYYLGIFSLYLIVKNLFNRRSALLASLLLGVYGWFLVSTGWDNVDGAAMAYMLLTILLLLYAARNRWWKLIMFAAGASSVTFFTTNLFLLSFSPFLAAFYLFANWKCRKNSLLSSLVVYVLGGIVAVVLFGLAYLTMTGDFFYFLDSIAIAKQLLSAPNPWINATAWYWNATWLVFPVVTTVSCILLWVIRRFESPVKSDSWVTFSGIWFVALFLLFLGLQLTPYGPVLQIFYYASYLIPPMFIVIGSILTAPLSRFTNRQFLWVGCCTCLFLSLSHMAFPSAPPPMAGMASTLPQLMPVATLNLPIWVPVVVILVGFMLSHRTSRHILIMGIVFLCFGLGNAFVISPLILVGDADSFSTVVSSSHVIKSLTPEATGYFWYDVHSTFGGVYQAIASTNLWGYRLINDGFPSVAGLGGQGKAQFYVGKKIILLSTDKNVLDQARGALSTIGFCAELVVQRPIAENNISFFITLVTISESKGCP